MDKLTLQKFTTTKGLGKPERNFFEFAVNSQPLSTLLTSFYGLKLPLLDNWIGVLGSFNNNDFERIKIKQLLGKEIPPTYQLSIEELNDPEVILYCCAECGDYECGGFKVKVTKTLETFDWTFTNEQDQLVFSFNKYEYFDVLNQYCVGS